MSQPLGTIVDYGRFGRFIVTEVPVEMPSGQTIMIKVLKPIPKAVGE